MKYGTLNITCSVHDIKAFAEGLWQVIEPVMTVEVTAPQEFQGAVLATLNRRHGIVVGQDSSHVYCTVIFEVFIVVCVCFV